MVQFINHYYLSAKLVKEDLFDKHNRKIFPMYLLWIILMFIAVIRFAMVQRIIWLLLTLVFLVLMAMTTRYKNINVLKEWRKTKRRYVKRYPEIAVEIGEVIAYSQDDKTHIYSWHDYDSFVETEHLLIMIMKDTSRILLKKDAFSTGSLFACQKLLKRKARQAR